MARLVAELESLRFASSARRVVSRIKPDIHGASRQGTRSFDAPSFSVSFFRGRNAFGFASALVCFMLAVLSVAVLRCCVVQCPDERRDPLGLT